MKWSYPAVIAGTSFYAGWLGADGFTAEMIAHLATVLILSVIGMKTVVQC
jgi:TolB-like protein